MITKQQALQALEQFVNSRPGFDYHSYGDATSYRSDMRTAMNSRTDALTMLRYIAMRDSITVDQVLDAAKHNFGGRLTIDAETGAIDYCAGQYYPTEYRRAAACVLAAAIWSWLRDNRDTSKDRETYDAGVVNYGGSIRKAARRELGASLARKYFN